MMVSITLRIGVGAILVKVGRKMRNNAINPGSEKRRSFVPPPFTAGYGER